MTEDDKCDLCEAHENAKKTQIDDSSLCPHCGSDDLQSVGLHPVGETNGDPTGQTIELRQVLACEGCRDYSMVVLQPIIYNANHDVYYTGGDKYLPVRKDGDELRAEIKAAILPSIEQYTTRLKAGEHRLEAWNLVCWIQYRIEDVVAKLLQRKHTTYQALTDTHEDLH